MTDSVDRSVDRASRPSQYTDRSSDPTDGRTDGRTYEESFSPTRDNPSTSVTRTRAYGDFSLADFEANPADTPSDLQDTRDRADTERKP